MFARSCGAGIGRALSLLGTGLWLAGCGPGTPPEGSRETARRAALRGLWDELRATGRGTSAQRAAIAAVWRRLLDAPLPDPLVTEHEERPRSLVLHIQSADTTILDQQVALLEQIPPDIGLRLVVGGYDAERALLARLGAGPRPELARQVELLRVPRGRFCSVWARDFALGDERCQVVPLFLRPGSPELDGRPDRPLNEVVELLAARGTRVLRAPLYFAGGNVEVGRRTDGRRLLFCGCNDYLLSRDAYREAGMVLGEEQLTAILRQLLAVDEVVVLGPRDGDGQPSPQAVALFHLDQAMLFPRDGEVIVHRVEIPADFVPPAELAAVWQRTLAAFAERWGLRPELARVSLERRMRLPRRHPSEPEGWQRALDELQATRNLLVAQRDVQTAARDLDCYATELGRHGFAVTRMPIAAERVLGRQYYLNSLLIPGAGGPPLVIMPTFGHVAPGAVGEDERAGRFLEARGLRVATVRDMAHIGQGSNHCLVRRG